MPNCQHCGHKWSWKETFVKIFTFRTKIRCSYCHSYQYVSKNSKNRFSLILTLFSLLFIPLVSFEIPIRYILAFEVCTYVLLSLGLPFFVTLSDEDEPMW